MRTTSQARALLSAGLLTAAGIAALPTHAAAATAGSPFTCEASALSLALLGQAPIEPVVANRGQSCQNATVGIGNLTQPLPAIFGASAINAATTAAGTDDKQQVLAAGGVADAAIGSLGDLGLPLDLSQIPLPAGLESVSIPLSSLTGPGGVLSTVGGVLGGTPVGGVVPTLPTSIDVNIADAVHQLLALPTTPVLSSRDAVAYAAGSCVSGAPVLSSARNVVGVKVLGQDIDVDTAGNTPIVDTMNIDFSQLDLSKVQLPLLDGLLPGQLDAVKALVASTLKALPPVQLPVNLAQVSVTPGAETRTATSIEQTGPTLAISALGQSVANLRLGEAKVGSAGVNCAPPAAAAPLTAADTALQCTKRKLVLVDVVRSGDHVVLTGAADKKFVGQFVTIRFEADNSVAGRALVRPDGSFTTTAPLPSAKLRDTNRARYQANIGSEKSLDLKLARRMTVQKLSSANGKVTIAGQITRPFAQPTPTIELRRRVSCKKMVVVKRFKPKADGSYTVTVDAPTGTTASVYRLATRVRKNATNAKTFPTFTLPRGVDLNQ